MAIFRRRPVPIDGLPPRPHKRQLRRAIGRLVDAQANHVMYRCADTHALVGVEQTGVTLLLDATFAYIDALEEKLNGASGE